MRKSLIGAIVSCAVLLGIPGLATAAPQSKLANGFHEALLSMTNADPWFLEGGCTGGTGAKDPLYAIAPVSGQATSECSVRRGTPIVFTAASITCWQATVAEARAECNAAWNDPALVLVEAIVEVDGKKLRTREYDTAGRVVFPEDAFFDVPGTEFATYGISVATVVRDLRPGVHVVHIAFEYADGFAGDVTMRLTVTR